VMAATLGRPLHVVGGAEGTALGASMLGLFALGRASTLTDAAAQLTGSAAAEQVEPDPQLVTTYDRLRASVPDLIGELGRVGALLSAAPRR
jgi:sugar (pentulose or hexulose) kinase